MHNVSANYTLPTILNSIKAPQIQGVVKARDTTGTGSTGASNGTSATDLQSTFLNLLSTELQNQDPTAPVDSTAMVGQMISLNQLDQLISINQAITSSSTPTTASGSVQKPASTSAAAVPASADATSSMSVTNQLPFDPTTMMPLANSGLAAALNSGVNALDLTGTTNHATGGK